MPATKTPPTFHDPGSMPGTRITVEVEVSMGVGGARTPTPSHEAQEKTYRESPESPRVRHQRYLQAYEAHLPWRMKSAMRSPIIMVVTLVLARIQSGIMEASTTRRFCRPCTWPCWSTTAMASEAGPILQVPEICWPVVTSRNRYSFNASSLANSASVGSMRSAMML